MLLLAADAAGLQRPAAWSRFRIELAPAADAAGLQNLAEPAAWLTEIRSGAYQQPSAPALRGRFDPVQKPATLAGNRRKTPPERLERPVGCP